MKRILICSATFLVVLLTAANSYGDVARPRASPSPAKVEKTFHYELTIVPDGKASEARLQIPESDLKYMAEALTEASIRPSLGQQIGRTQTRTIIAGLFLFLSVSFAGVWLARSAARRSHKALGAVLLVVAVLSATTLITQANIGPPGYVRWAGLPKALTEGRSTGGGVNIEITEGNDWKLIVPVRKGKNANGEE